MPELRHLQYITPIAALTAKAGAAVEPAANDLSVPELSRATSSLVIWLAEVYVIGAMLSVLAVFLVLLLAGAVSTRFRRDGRNRFSELPIAGKLDPSEVRGKLTA